MRNAIIKEFEGFVAKPYLCPAGVWTIGYGTTRYPNGKPVTRTDPAITEKQAEEYLEHHVKGVRKDLAKLVTWQLNDNQMEALVSLAYNVGTGTRDGIKGDLADSTLIAHINSGRIGLAADEFLKWKFAGGKAMPGLLRRRQAERDLFLS